MTDKNLALSPSDIVGALQRRAAELTSYFASKSSMEVDVPAAKTHMAEMFERLDVLESMQDQVKAHHAQNGNGEARAN